MEVDHTNEPDTPTPVNKRVAPPPPVRKGKEKALAALPPVNEVATRRTPAPVTVRKNPRCREREKIMLELRKIELRERLMELDEEDEQ